MKNRPLLALVLAHALLVSVAGQSPSSTAQTPAQKREGAPEKDDVGNALVHRHDRGLGGGHHLELGAELRAYK